MFEDFRKQAEQSNFLEENPEEELRPKAPRNEGEYFLGLTPIQRFIVAFMLLCMTIILGVLFLIVTSKVVFPFFG
jgi:hypothetical protein